MHATIPSTRPADLVGQLELAFRQLGKRVYLPSLRSLHQSGFGVDKATFPLIAVLDEGDARPSDLASALELDLSTVSRQVKHLEAAGLVVRRPDDVDGRACVLSLTDQGRDGLGAVRATRAELLDAVLTDWSDEDRADLLRLLERLVTGVHNLPPNPAQHHPAPADTASRPSLILETDQ